MAYKNEAARCAAEIRKFLKEKKIKASVRSSVFAGGDSVDVEIKEIINPEDYNKLQDGLRKYQYGHFDGMIDLYESSNLRDDIPQVKFLQVNYDYNLSDGFIERLINILVEKINLDADWEYRRLAGDILYGKDDWIKWEEVKHLANLEVA